LRIALCDWSLHREFQAGKISLFDYFKIAKERFKLDAVEFGSWLFKSFEDDYLNELRRTIDGLGLKVVNLNVDVGNISQRDDEKRRKDAEMLKGWFRIAKAIGSPSFRVNTGNGVNGIEEALHRCITSYKELTNLAEKGGIRVLIENHGGLSANPDNIVRIIKEVKSDYLKAAEKFKHRIYHVHAKDTEIIQDALNNVGIYGSEWWRYRIPGWGVVDWRKLITILLDANYRGDIDIEHEDPVFHGPRFRDGLVLGLRYLSQFIPPSEGE
jgi:sugar phosphate isomerase/epimerase